MEGLSDPQIFWPLVVFLVAVRGYVSASAVILRGLGLIPDGYTWYVFWAELLGSVFNISYASDDELKKLKKRVKRLESQLGEQEV